MGDVRDEETEQLIRRFVDELVDVAPVSAVWAHGSLALGDYRQGRSDLDMLAVVESAPDERLRAALCTMHRALQAELPLAARLNCSYLVRDELADPERRHLTWAHQDLLERPVTPVTRRELLLGGRTLHGEHAEAMVPPVSDQVLAEFIRTDLREYWLPATEAWRRWLDDVWVDVGLLTLARGTTTLRDGRLLTKGQAIPLLGELGVSAWLVRDIHERRYGKPERLGWGSRRRRAVETRRVMRAGIAAALGQGVSAGRAG
ncbi:putative nucleotidyltransferase [Kitasatospora sp. MAA4]|uniref:nucleotidyltransferase domain-containing protein n=1 Tax=Kitasatospora sp. MAA4 TaxID=3035093 RepID=UPI002473AD32|nr:nucleotidyltransferase domain-containing protein [Kitasatospora sp. MAA4]MDH6131194.1 putative nucleotidyltransferase [Kitasatospora sp. MAA4]